jgi:23S rRNA (guanosine2251-2'-O)-methyltransferase
MSKEFSIVECSNPECKFRFPIISTKSPRWCPKCKSNLIIVHSYTEVLAPIKQTTMKNNPPSFNLLLDNIRSAYNIGSILRTIDGFNVGHIYFCGISPSPENPKVEKTSLGAEKNKNWSTSNNALLVAEKLKKEGNYLIGLEYCKDSIPITLVDENKLNHPIVLIIGNELAGIDPAIRKICDELVHIPMNGNKSSFNVSIAFGIAAFYFDYIRH